VQNPKLCYFKPFEFIDHKSYVIDSKVGQSFGEAQGAPYPMYPASVEKKPEE